MNHPILHKTLIHHPFAAENEIPNICAKRIRDAWSEARLCQWNSAPALVAVATNNINIRALLLPSAMDRQSFNNLCNVIVLRSQALTDLNKLNENYALFNSINEQYRAF